MLQRRVYGDLKGLKRSIRRKLGRVARRLGPGYRIYVRSGFRTYAEQAALYRSNMYPDGRQRPGRPLTARPGTSRHESGRAADIAIKLPSGALVNPGPRTRAAARVEGLHFPVRGEVWHVEER
jgi:D-alanyl-D-alanine carboxypeptidase